MRRVALVTRCMPPPIGQNQVIVTRATLIPEDLEAGSREETKFAEKFKETTQAEFCQVLPEFHGAAWAVEIVILDIYTP